MLKTKTAQIVALVLVMAIVVIGAAVIINGGFSGLFGIGGKSGTSKSDASVYELIAKSGSQTPDHQPIDNFAEWIKTTDKPIFVDFWADWCAPCRTAAPFVESLATEYAGKAHIVKIDVDEESALARAYNATSIPLFVFIKDGKVVSSMAGYSSARDNQIRDALNLLLD